MTRKDFLFLKEKLSYQFQMHFKLFLVYLSVLFSGELAQAENKSKKTKPNVLFIAVDDLNDWVGCLGGHPQAKTPNIDAFADQGVLFEELTFESIFESLKKSQCSECHVPRTAGDGCVVCHNYHVGTFPPLTVSTAGMTKEAKPSELSQSE